jgi:hypothetical protein
LAIAASLMKCPRVEETAEASKLVMKIFATA